MSSVRDLVRSGLGAVLLHPLRSAATVACATGVLVPFLAGSAVSRGLLDQASDAARFGADLTVGGLRFGRSAPLPASLAEDLRSIPGVTRVRPRITANLQLGSAHEPAVVVGVEDPALPEGNACAEGRLFSPGGENELVLGAALAARLGLKPGDVVPPFYSSREGVRISTVVGVFRSDLPMWEAHLVFTSLGTAQRVFDAPGTVTEFLVDCEDGYEDAVRRAIVQRLGHDDDASLKPRVLAREDREALLVHHAASGAGVFALHWLLLLGACVPALVVTSGAGLRERRRETGVLKMLGWGTDEVILRALVESLVLSMLAASLSVLLAALWLGPLGARGVGAVFLAETDVVAGFTVPWRMTPGPALAGAALAITLILLGTLPSTWRSASAEPMEAMR